MQTFMERAADLPPAGQLQVLRALGKYSPEDSKTVYKPKDFLDIAKGNIQYALALRQRVTWQHPTTLADEDLREGEIIEFNGQYLMTGGVDIEIQEV